MSADIEQLTCVSYLSGVASYAIDVVCDAAEDPNLVGQIWDSRNVDAIRSMKRRIIDATDLDRVFDLLRGVNTLCAMYDPGDSSERSGKVSRGVVLLKSVYTVISKRTNLFDLI
jgi:hypothetical protein